MGGRGNFSSVPRHELYPHPDHSPYADRLRPCPPDFRERYITDGWDAQIDLRCNWRTFCRWVDLAGADELRAARAEYVRKNGRRIRTCVGSDSTTDSAWYDKRSRRIAR